MESSNPQGIPNLKILSPQSPGNANDEVSVVGIEETESECVFQAHREPLALFTGALSSQAGIYIPGN